MDTSTVDTHAPRRRYARGEGDRLRDDLLDAAAELMATHGSVDQVSLRAVARRAGVSPTAVYRHFDDHVDLLRESVQFCWANFNEALSASYTADDDPFEAFRQCGDAYCRFAEEKQGQYRVLFSNRIDLQPQETSEDTETQGGMETFGLLVDLVARMLAELDDHRDPFFVAVQVNTWIHGIVDICGGKAGGPWPSVDSLLDGMTESLGLERPAS